MLRSFRVANHKSIKDEQELLLMPAYDRNRLAVPVVGIFGANASGKSNLLDALRWMQTAVRESFASWEPGRGVPRTPFRLAPAGGQPSHYVIEIVVDEVRHTYGFVADSSRVREEWLYTYPHNRKRIIFERGQDGWVFGTAVPRSEVELVRKLTRDNALFLSVAARSDLAATLPVYQWFQGGLTFHDPSLDFRDEDVVAWLDGSPEQRSRLVALVRAADLGIADVTTPLRRPPYYEQLWGELRRERANLASASEADKAQLELGVRWLEDEIAASDSPELMFIHGDKHMALLSREQSKGTLAWIQMLLPALHALEGGSLLCVDEIDSSLHPHLTAQLVALFHDPEANKHGAQLMFTTHDATLLGTSAGEDILHRDEVWFVEKDGHSGVSTLYALTDFHPRKEESTQRRYLGGSYGAVPLLGTPDIRRALGVDPWAENSRATA